MSYTEPKVQATQNFVNESTAAGEQNFYACVVGPGYRIETDEETVVTYTTSSNAHTYLLLANEYLDTRVTDTEELCYPISVWIEDARAEALATGGGNLGSVIYGTTSFVDSGAPFTETANGQYYVQITGNAGGTAAGTISHHVNDILSISIAAIGVVTIVFDSPLLTASDDDVRKDFYNGNTGEVAPILSVSSDRTTITVDTSALVGADFANQTISGTGNLIYGAPNVADAAVIYTASKTSTSTMTLGNWAGTFECSAVEYNLVDKQDVTLTKTTDWTTTSTILTVLTTVADSNAHDLITAYGTIHVAYRALEAGLALSQGWVYPATYTADITADIGAIVRYNTLAYGTYEAARNSSLKVCYVGVDETWLTDKSLAMTEATSYLSDKSDVYHIAPLTLNTTAHSTWDASVTSCSLAANGCWRVVYIARELQTSQSVLTDTTPERDSEGFINKLFRDSTGSFTTATAGDYLKVTGWTDIDFNPIVVDSAAVVAGTAISWNPGSMELTVAENLAAKFTAPYNVTVAVGKNINLTSGGSSAVTSTSADSGIYIDSDHTSGSNGLLYSDLGYRCTGVVHAGATTVFTLEGVGAAAVLDEAGGAAETLTIDIVDSIMSATQETALLANENTIISISDDYNMIITDAIGTRESGIYSGVTYNIYTPMTKNEQATMVAAYATSFANRRTRLVWPDYMMAADGTTKEWGYFLACSVAGWYSGHAVQQGMTRSTCGAGYEIKHSNGYFNTDQLNTIAEGAVSIFTQSTDGANVMCRQQISTDDSTIYYSEPSITHSVDYITYQIVSKLDKLIGKYNVTPELMDTVTMLLESVKTKALKKKARVGGVVKKMDIVFVRQDTDNLDIVEVELDVKPNVPCNGFSVNIKVS